MKTLRSYLDEVESSNVATVHFHDGAWREQTYGALRAAVKETANGFATACGVKPRTEIASIILPNSPTWIACYLALAGTGVGVVPLDPKLRESEVAYILGDSCAVLVVTDKAHIPMLRAIIPQLPHLRTVVVVDMPGYVGDAESGNVKFISLADVRKAQGDGSYFDANRPAADDVASIIYTSGTTGKPKGAMLTHRNFISDIEGSLQVFGAPIRAKDSFFIVLPMFHAFSFTTNLVLPLMIGARMCFNQSLRTVAQDLRTLRPSLMMAVPLLAEKLHNKIEESLAKSRLARFLMKIGLRGPVMHMVRLQLGGRLRFIITGGAPCPRPVLEGFNRIHVRFLEGYGLTECSPVVSVCPPEVKKCGTIGRPIGGIEVRLADQNEQGVGELQVKGDNVMKGYLRNESATAEAFDGEWLRTGDLASMDEEGLITIRGRKKALIVNREGKNIYPEEVEHAIAQDPFVSDIIVIGYHVDKTEGEFVGAIVHPNEDIAKLKFPEAAGDWAKLEKLAIEHVRERTMQLADYKRPRKIVVVKEELERTAIKKVRRVAYQGALDEK